MKFGKIFNCRLLEHFCQYFRLLEHFCQYFLTHSIHVQWPSCRLLSNIPPHTLGFCTSSMMSFTVRRWEKRHYVLLGFFVCLLVGFCCCCCCCLLVIIMNFVLSWCGAMWFISVQSIKSPIKFCNEAWGVFKSAWWLCKEVSSANSPHIACV